MTAPGHKPSRPSWTCLTCHQLWPCPGGRKRLRKQFGPDKIGLSIHMVSLLHIASTDIYLRAGRLDANPTALHVRFIFWTR